MTAADINVIDEMKELLSEDKNRIRLDDYATSLLQTSLDALRNHVDSAAAVALTSETFREHLDASNEVIANIVHATILIARWGRADQSLLIQRIVSWLSALGRNGSGVWRLLGWYPLSVISYGAGISALFAQNHWVLRSLFLTPVASDAHSVTRVPAIVKTSDGVGQLTDAFKWVSGNPNHRVPRSEYMFASMQKPLVDVLFLGECYESLFDEFEILSALTYADLTARTDGSVWAMPGRFAWKFKHSGQPYDGFVQDVVTMGSEWPLLKLGFFRRSEKRFQEVAAAYRNFLVNLQWY